MIKFNKLMQQGLKKRSEPKVDKMTPHLDTLINFALAPLTLSPSIFKEFISSGIVDAFANESLQQPRNIDGHDAWTLTIFFPEEVVDDLTKYRQIALVEEPDNGDKIHDEAKYEVNQESIKLFAQRLTLAIEEKMPHFRDVDFHRIDAIDPNLASFNATFVAK